MKVDSTKRELKLYRGSLRSHLHRHAEPGNSGEFRHQHHGHCYYDRTFGQRATLATPSPGTTAVAGV